MRITIKTVAGRAFAVEVPDTDTVQALRQRIADEHDYDLEGLKLVAGGAVLTDSMTVGEAHLSDLNFVVMIAKKKAVRTQQENAKQKEKEKEKVKEVNVSEKGDPPPGPLDDAQITGLIQLQGLLKTKARSMKDFGELLRFHGTVTDIRLLVQKDQSLLAPILYQMNYHTPQLLSAINNYQKEFLQIINEPVRRYSMESYEDFEGSVSSNADQEVVYISPEEEDAIQRLSALGFSYQMAAEAFIACNRQEELAASYLFELLEQAGPNGEAGGSVETPDMQGIAPEDTSSLPSPQVRTLADMIAEGAIEEALVAAEMSRPDSQQSDCLPSSSAFLDAFDSADVRQTAAQTDVTIVFYSAVQPNGELYTWVISPAPDAPIHFQQLKGEVEQMEGGLVALNRSLVRSSGINPQSVWRRVLRQLHTILVEPIAPFLPRNDTDVICFIPSPGAMCAVPFAALLAEDDTFLVQRHPISIAYSIRMLAAAQQAHQLPGKPGCLLDVGTSLHDLPPELPVQRTSVDTLSAADMQASTAVHLPTLDDVKKLLALQNADSPHKVDMVVLAKGEESTGKRSPGLEDLSLAVRDMVAAGVPSVIVPFWTPNQPANHQQVLKDFYQTLMTSPLKALALRQAMLDMMQKPNVGIWDWAAWTLVGHGADTSALQVPPKTKSSSRKRRETRHTADYRYLQRHRIHVLYEQLVRELLEQRPEDVPRHMLLFMQQKRAELQALMMNKQ